MKTQIKKIGNSKGILIPSAVIKNLNLNEFDELQIEIKENIIILMKVQDFNPKSLDELFAGYTGEYEDRIVFEEAKGREIW